ncbi:rhomboid family intramembrane serine protease [uncultured Cohaesibacter sp.]|uniref:rhomboid family intramembrane serine protease n=1 Tax=uncultured Cohaesibacter sp. TaxID=1002546 RepID=UPI00292DD032|nr:rhomboid family intramembrane serine protease [uncultured Cohaesibacter sp.]
MFIPLHDRNELHYVRLQYVTIGLIALNVIIFLMTGAGSNGLQLKEIAYAYGLIPSHFTPSELTSIAATAPSEWTDFITYSFLHGGWMHLIGNMAFLWVFGDNIEDAVGHFKFLIFYCLCAAGAAALHMLANWGSPVPLIGASGATAGIIAAYLMLTPDVRVWILLLGRIPLPIPAIYCLGAWLLMQLFNSLTSTEDTVAWWAHVGGALTGAILIPIMKRKSVPLFQRAK